VTAVARTRAELRELRAAWSGGAPSAVVLTMGALHDGHLALMRSARRRIGAHGRLLVTIFVNPLQFGAGEDFERYPRPFDADLRLCRQEGVDVVFAPAPEEVYPSPPQVSIDPGPLGGELEGAVRPGHFAGVLTVVCKLLHLTGADSTFFGEKDFQQLVLVRRMVEDLGLTVDVVGVATVREDNGLARSSRNRYLSPAQRQQAAVLGRALRAGAAAADGGPAAVLAAARAELADEPAAALDYLELRAPDLGPVRPPGEARLLVAARFGTTRLIDNCRVELLPAPP
jgi:pantoate--beta-alanine ligase